MSDTGKAISWILKGGLLLTPFLVFVVTRSLYFPFITGKNFTFRILTEILAVIWVYAALRYPRFRPRSSPVAWAVIGFIAVMGIATIFSLSPYRSFWSNFERMEGYIGLLHLFLYFLLLSSVFTSERDWRIFFHTSLAASVIISFYAIGQLAGTFAIHQGGTRVDATFGNATYLAAYLLFHIFFALWFLLRSRERWLQAVYGAVILLELTILYHTATRGAILGLIGGGMAFAALVALLNRGFLRKAAAGGLVVVVLVPILFFLVKDTSFVRESPILTRFATISPSETTTQARFTIWGMALQGWRERPVLGWGQDQFIYVFSKHYEPSLWRQEPWFDRAHNVFLDWLTAGGILGLVSYLGMFASSGWVLARSFRAGRLDAISFGLVSALLLAHFFQILFVFDNLTSYLLFFAVLAYLHAVASETAVSEVAADEKRKSGRASRRGMRIPLGTQAAVTAVVAAAFVLVFYVANVKPILAAGDILDALKEVNRAQAAGKVDAVIANFQKGLERQTFGTTELREQISQLAGTLLRDTSIAQQDKEKFMIFAIQELEAQRRAFPSDIRAKAFLGTLYVSVGRPAEAIAVVEEALAISSRRPHFYFIAAEAYLNANQGERAIEVLRNAYELDPTYPEAVSNLGIVYIVTGRDEDAQALFLKHYGIPVLFEERYAQAYTQIGRFDIAAEIWEGIVKSSPADARLHAALGVAYARSGRPEKGVAEIRRAIELEPRFKAEGEAIIGEIQAGRLR